MKLAFLDDSRTISPRWIKDNISKLVEDYLKQSRQMDESTSLSDASGRNGSRSEARDTLLRMLHDKREPVVPKVYLQALTTDDAGFDWDSDLPLDVDQFRDICETLSHAVIIASGFNGNRDIDYYYKVKKQLKLDAKTTPGDMMARELLGDGVQDERFGQVHTVIIDGFGDFLRNMFTMEIAEPADIQANKASENNFRIFRLGKSILEFSHRLNYEDQVSDQNLFAVVTNSLINIIESEDQGIKSSEKFSDFCEALNLIFKNLQNGGQRHEDLLGGIRDLISDQLPNFLANNEEPIKLRVARFNDPDGKPMLIPADNFFFDHPDDNANPTDSLMLDRKYGIEMSGDRDTLFWIYDNEGHNIFNGCVDLRSIGDGIRKAIPIDELYGPLYILQQGCFDHLPEWADLEREVGGPIRLGVSGPTKLDLGFIRYNADFMIYNNELKENKKSLFKDRNLTSIAL